VKGSFSVVTRSPDETRIAGASLAAVVLPGDVVSISGDLGAGKTVFVQGLAAALGVIERVTSPTFTIHHQYTGRYALSHVDVYRLGSFQEVLDLGLEELLAYSILVIEWGDAIAPLLPRRRLEVHLRTVDDSHREITLRATSGDWAQKLETVKTTVETLLAAAAPEEPPVDEPAAGETAEAAPTRDDRGKAAGPGEEEEKG
jgi:tRNA threonylcarbamoyladenosine biosynthesis protein TsaE